MARIYYFEVAMLTTCIIGLVPNSICLTYYLAKGKSSVSNRMFVSLTLADIITLVFVAISQALYIAGKDSQIIEVRAVNTISFIAVLLSAFCTVTISVTRTIIVVQPFYHIPRRGFSLLAGIAAIGIVIPFTLLSYISNHKIISCAGGFYLISSIIIANISSCIMIYVMCYKSEHPSNSTNSTDGQDMSRRNATLTVVLLSSVFTACHATSGVVFLVTHIGNDVKITKESREMETLSIFASFVINAVGNTMILMNRNNKMRVFTKKLLGAIFRY